MLFHSVQGAGGLGSGSPPTLSYVNTSTYTATAASFTHSIARPSGTQYRDLLFLFIASGSSATITLDSGWTVLRNFSDSGLDRTVVAYRHVKGNEASSYTITQSSSRGLVAACIAFRGALYNSNVTTKVTSATAPLTITPFSTANDALIYASALGSGSLRTSTPPSGYTEVAELYTAVSDSEVNLTVTYRVPNASQSTTGVTNTWSNSNDLRAYFVDIKQA